MYDSDQPQAIPSGVWAAGYVDGYAASAWASVVGFPRFPGARRIAVFLATTVVDGDSFDVENGDMTPAEAPTAVANAHARGIAMPWVYCDRSTRPAVENALIMNGVLSDQVALWIATLDGTQTVPPGPYPVAAVQYLNPAHGSGGHYDLSLVNVAFGPGGGTITAAWRMVKSVASNDTFLVFGIGDDDSIYYQRWDGTKWVQGALNGQVSDFVVTASGQRLDVYGRGLTDRAAYHWFSSDGGVAFSGFEALGGSWKSPLQAVGPAAPSSGGTEPAEPTKISLHIPAVPGDATGTLS